MGPLADAPARLFTAWRFVYSAVDGSTFTPDLSRRLEHSRRELQRLDDQIHASLLDRLDAISGTDALTTAKALEDDAHITVQDIVDRADVGRSTFYAHYRDKKDLLLNGFEDIRAALAVETQASETETRGQVEFLQRPTRRHLEGYRQTCGPLSRKGGADVITRILRQHVVDLVREHFPSRRRAARASPARPRRARQ